MADRTSPQSSLRHSFLEQVEAPSPLFRFADFKALRIEIAQSSAEERAVFRLRHQVYCVERGHQDLPGNVGEEFDEVDAHSRHVLLRHGDSGELVGTARLICINPLNPGASFQIQKFCAPALLAHLPLRTSGEISRLAISKSRQTGFQSVALMRLALVRGLVQLSSELGITHWLALQERSLMRLNERNALRFDPIGPPVACHGIRQPTAVDLAEMLEGMRREQFPNVEFPNRRRDLVRQADMTVTSTKDRESSARENVPMDMLGIVDHQR
jgi:N-acyl-L-homoserine lactone synthetase